MITVMALQSYGPRWEGSRVAVRAEASSSSTSSPFSSSHGYRHLLPEAVVLSGEHGRSTSELYNHEIVLGGGCASGGGPQGGGRARWRNDVQDHGDGPVQPVIRYC